MILFVNNNKGILFLSEIVVTVTEALVIIRLKSKIILTKILNSEI
jgi:hypothetical protein